MTTNNQIQGMVPRLMGVGTAAAYLGLGKKAIYRLVEKREIPYVRIAAKVFFEKPALEAWIAQHRVEPEPVPCTSSPSRTSTTE